MKRALKAVINRASPRIIPRLRFLQGLLHHSPPPLKAVALYRVSRYFWVRGHRILARHYENLLYYRCGCTISCEAEIGEGVWFPHPTGIVIGKGSILGRNVTVYQSVTLGRKDRTVSDYPRIGDDVTIYPGSVVIGAIVVGKGTTIGANSVVLADTEENSVYAGVPARRLR